MTHRTPTNRHWSCPGEEIDPILDWQRLTARANEGRKPALSLLLDKVKDWRAESAKQLSMAPAAVLAQNTMFKVAVHAAR